MKKKDLIWLGAGTLAAILLPLLVSDQYMLHIGVMILIYVGITVAWNIMAVGGILSLGHAAFFGVGAYTVAILYTNYQVNPWLGLFLAGIAAAVSSLILVIPLVRLRGPFFTLATLAFVEVLRLLSIWAVPITKGSVGITTPPLQGFAYISFENREPYYFIALVLTFLTVLLSIWIYRSKLGYHLRATDSNEEAVRALGVRSNRVKIGSMLISSAVTGIFGAFAALYFFVIEPDTQFSSTLYSIQPALNGIIGGMGTIAGPIIGAIIMTPLGEWLRVTFSGASQGVNFMIYGLVLIVMVRMMPGGLVDGFRRLFSKFKKTDPDVDADSRPEPEMATVGKAASSND